MPEELMFEYEQLRKEILQNHTLTLQVMGGVLVIASALVTYILTKEHISCLLKAFLFLLLGVVASLGLLQDIYLVGSTYIIASYIKNFIEPNMNVKWETKIAEFRNIKEHGIPTLSSHRRAIYTALIVT